jgi:chitodextrinase
VTRYQVYRGGAQIASVIGLSYADSGLNPSTAYSYTVKAIDAAGNLSAASNTLDVTTSAASGNLALGKTMTTSGFTQVYGPGNANDNNTSTYWESTNNAFPQWLQCDLGSSTSVRHIVLTLPPSWGQRNQTLSVLGSNDGTNFTTIVGSAGYSFDPASGNTVTVTFTASTQRYWRLNYTANTGWPVGQASEFQIYSS